MRALRHPPWHSRLSFSSGRGGREAGARRTDTTRSLTGEGMGNAADERSLDQISTRVRESDFARWAWGAARRTYGGVQTLPTVYETVVALVSSSAAGEPSESEIPVTLTE